MMTGRAVAAEAAESGEAEVEYEDPTADVPEDGEGQGKKGGFQGWEAEVSDKLYYVNKAGQKKRAIANLSAYGPTDYADTIRSRHLWWDDILYFPEHEELCLWIALAFRSVPNMLRYAWAEKPEFMTEEVKATLANRTQGQGAEIPTDEEDDAGEVSAVQSRARGSKALTSTLSAGDTGEYEGVEGAEELEEELEVVETVETGEETEGLADEGTDLGFEPDDIDVPGEEDAETEAQVQAAAAAARQRAAKRQTAAAKPAAATPPPMVVKKKVMAAPPPPAAPAGRKTGKR